MRSFAYALMASTAIGTAFICSHSAFAQSSDTSTTTVAQSADKSGTTVAQASENSETTVLDPIVVKDDGEAESAPGTNETTVDQEQIQQEGGRKLDDILRTVPGVFTRENPQQPGVAVNLRGFEGSGRVNMSIDGVRQSFRFTGHEAGGFTYVDSNLLSGIDITRGGVTTTGGGGLAGSVNFRTLDFDDVLAADRTYGGLARLSWGSNGVGFSEMVSSAARIGSAEVLGAISKRDSDDYKDGDGDTVDNTGQDLISGLFKTRFAIGEDQTLSLGGIFYNNDFFANSYDQTINNKTYSAKYHYDPSSDLIDLRVNGYYNDLDMEYTGGSGSYVGRTIEDKGAGFDVSNVSQLDLAGIPVRSTNGVEYFYDWVDSDDGGVNPGSGRSGQGGVFTENTFTYGRFDLTAGLRYSFYNVDGSGTLSSSYGDYDVDISEGSVDPKLTLAYSVTPWLQPYVTWSRSMRAPTLQETMLGGNHPGSTSASFIPNPTLDPETQQGWEFGANIRKEGLLRAEDALSVKADYFIMKVEDYIVGQYSSSEGGYLYDNVDGTSEVQGFEFEANYDAGFAFTGLSYTHSESDLPSQFAGLGASQYLPDDTVSATAGVRFLDRRLTVGGRYTYVSDGLTASYNSSYTGGEATQGGEAYNLVDLFSTFKVNERADLSFRVSNLLDESYTPFLSTTGTGQGRTFYLTAQVRF